MLLSNRRLRLLFLCLAGVEAGALTPFALLLYHRPGLWQGLAAPRMTPLGLFLLLWATLLGLILALDLLSRSRLTDRQYTLTVVALVVTGSFLGIRLFVYPGMPVTDLAWILASLRAIFNFHRGIRPELLFFLINLLLWQRANNATSRDLGFFSVGVTFRASLLLLILGGGLWESLRPAGTASGLPLLWIFLFLGLMAVALARIDDKATSSPGSSGGLLPLDRLGQLLLMGGLTVGGALLLAQLYTPAHIRTFLGWFAPLWRLLGQLLFWALWLLLFLLQPLLLWLQGVIARMLANVDLAEYLANLNLQPQDAQELAQEAARGPAVPAWIWTALRYGLVLAVMSVLVLFVWVHLERRRRASTAEEAEETGRTESILGETVWQRGLDRLRNLARMVGRYGLGSQLLAAISVENIYANLLRLARSQGHPRPPALPPDEYLPRLQAAFPGQEEALARITQAYMQVHYGDRPVDPRALAQLRDDYANIQAALAE